MENIKKYKSDDGYSVYEVYKNGENFFLANKENYKKDIQDLVEYTNGIFYDAIVLIFGIDSGSYLCELQSNLCERNKVIIIEPNEEIYNTHKDKIKSNNIELIFYEELSVGLIIEKYINYRNLNRFCVYSFGNYNDVYSEEYDRLIEIIEDRYYKASSTIDVFVRMKDHFFNSLLLNLSTIQDSSPLNSYIDINKNKPAIIVSAGPSLDKNIQELISNKDKLDNYFIIVSNRTIGPLLENDIKPNLVVTLDPVPEIYDMMKEYMDEEIPIAFYEHSNWKLLRDYKGEKIYISEVLSNIIDECRHLIKTYIGGSVAHSSIDIARILGCNPIILVGQDCALTYDKSYSNCSQYGTSNNYDKQAMITDKDVYGNDIKTNVTLKFFRLRIEEYIKLIQSHQKVEFFNASYGANILGAPHKELEEILKSNQYNQSVNNLTPDKCVKINSKEILKELLEHINSYIEKSDICIKKCEELLKEKDLKSLVELDDKDEELQKFLYVMEVVHEFEQDKMNYYLSSYYKEFLFNVRQKYFQMLSSDYDKLTSDTRYQSNTFLNYFIDLKKMLLYVKGIVSSVVADLR